MVFSSYEIEQHAKNNVIKQISAGRKIQHTNMVRRRRCKIQPAKLKKSKRTPQQEKPFRFFNGNTVWRFGCNILCLWCREIKPVPLTGLTGKKELYSDRITRAV